MKQTLIKFFTVIFLGCMAASCQGGNSIAPKEQQTAKYVFYFIGDGMGLAQVALAEAYQAYEQTGAIGNIPLCFSKFPVLGLATTFSASNIITCSSAAGTALSTGFKTNNNMLGIAPDSTTHLTSISYKIKEAGYKVGITSTVTLDHATPGAFYAHSTARSDYYGIALELPQTGFDFFGGGGFLQPNGPKKDQESVFTSIDQAGYQVVYGPAAYQEAKSQQTLGDKVILLQDKDRNYLRDLPYAIDRKEGDMTQAQVVATAIDFLENEKGFFLMSEGGKIDWACHSNDAKTAWMEVIDFASAVEVAVAFAQRHPNETLIVVTADHETGGLALGHPSGYSMYFDKMAQDTVSIDVLNATKQKDYVTEVRQMMEDAHIGWTTSAHTGIMVPVYAMGAGSELFNGRMDNTDIPKFICKVMGVAF